MDTLRNYTRTPKSEIALPASNHVGNEATLSWEVRRRQITPFDVFPLSAIAVLLP